MILVSHIEQSIQVERAWVKFLLEESQGFTDIGIERINREVSQAYGYIYGYGYVNTLCVHVTCNRGVHVLHGR